ncbi:glycosyltransferase family 2 protein [Streptomyces sp. TRM66268-LWL]|uniref:Glycosyltransferase family 2 protein n=1 Tax=Streptomyces polyasparticus TaxID=2767826 RepID=A0ABR7SNY5_9ACTN|nr:glycosyltransferase family A protein [Streptomyces polyasparticus]MBC9716292.1 glycosyltransferase family 2 protein [Streptomyces polyasparticus]
MTVKVSVIIPVYNAGSYIDRPINSILKQSLPQDELEVIFVNDGSTDDSEERLQDLAEKTENFRVFSIPNSGWPGRPRNVGVANARGEYVHFVDQDDALGPKALEVMYDRAVRSQADIVVGKVKGNMRGPIRLFRESVEGVGPEFAELYETLTPHKMFRRQFLLDNDITFQEGRCRLEDQMFLAKAFPLAKSIAVVGDVVCYDWSKRDDGDNNSKGRTEPADYYPWLAKAAQIVKANTAPGPVRDAFLRRNYRVEVLRNCATPGFLRGDAFLMEHYRAARKVAVEEYTDSVREGLPPLWRFRAELMEADRVEDLRKVALRFRDVVGETEFAEPARWRQGVLVAPFRARLRYEDGATVKVRKVDDGYGLDLALVHGVDGGPEWTFEDIENRATVDFQLRQRGKAQAWFADVESKLVVADDGTVEIEGTVRIDPDTAACGGRLPKGLYDVHVNVQLLGIERMARIEGGPASARLPCGGGRSRRERIQTVPYWTKDGRLALDIGANMHRVADRFGGSPHSTWRKVARKIKRVFAS